MKRFLLRFTVNILAFTISFAAAMLTHALWRPQIQHRVNVDLQSRTKIDPLEPKPVVHEDDFTVEGRYVNFDYAYSVLVPKGMMGAMSPAPNPNHGFGIDLMNPTSTSWTLEKGGSKACVWADASYDSAEYGSPNVVIKNSLESLKEKHSRVRLVNRTATRLGNLRAVRFVIAYEESDESMIEDQIVAFRSQLGEGSDIVYTIELRTLASHYYLDKLVALQMQRSWFIDPLPNDYPLPPAYEESK